MWVRQEENSNSKGGREPYDFIRRFDPDPIKGLKITALSISPSEDSLAVATRNNNITLINVKSIGLNEEPKPQIQCINVCSGFHSGAISQIDVAVQRPILATCSRDDSTVRLWNYFTYNCELARDFFVDKDLPPL
jgi:WD40 repeat protein